MPTRKELQSLVDSSQFGPAINTTYFPDTVSSSYWSSTAYAEHTNNEWVVNFLNGYDSLYYMGRLMNNYIRAVRGGSLSHWEIQLI